MNTIIGALIGIGVAVITIAVIFSLIKTGNPGQDSLIKLTQKAQEIHKQGPGANGQAIHFQDKDSYYYPITKETRNKIIANYNRLIADIIVTPETSRLPGEIVYVLAHTTKFPDCETQDCLCLCQEFDDEVVKRCRPGKLICEQLPEISLSPGTEVMFKKTDETPAMQQVQFINCRDRETYCKNSQNGDISIIFNWLDRQGIYNAIK